MKTLSDIPAQKNRSRSFGPAAPVEILQWEFEFENLLDLYVQRRPKRVLEIGTYHGGTLYHWLKNATRDTTVVSVDSYAAGVDNRRLYDAWTPPGVTLKVLCGDCHSDEIALEAKLAGPFDWIFIDADHYYESVKRDWETYRPMAADDGVIVLHDVEPQTEIYPEIQVNQLWREIQREGYVTQELVAAGDVPGCGIGIVYLG